MSSDVKKRVNDQPFKTLDEGFLFKVGVGIDGHCLKQELTTITNEMHPLTLCNLGEENLIALIAAQSDRKKDSHTQNLI